MTNEVNQFHQHTKKKQSNIGYSSDKILLTNTKKTDNHFYNLYHINNNLKNQPSNNPTLISKNNHNTRKLSKQQNDIDEIITHTKKQTNTQKV